MINSKILFAFAFLLAVGLTACGNNGEENNSTSNIERKKDHLRNKKQDLRNLQRTIAELEAEIEALENGYSRGDAVLVELDTLRNRDLKHYSVFQGNLETRNQVMASAEVSGRIVELLVDEGDRVQRDQLIATLDTEVIDKQISEVETTLRLARDVYERQKRLWDQNIGSEVQFLEAQNSVERLEKNLDVLQAQRSRAVVKAPKTGVLDQLLLREGELASPGTPVAVIVDMDNLKLSVSVPENFLMFIDRGDDVEIYFPSLDKTLQSTINRVGSTIDPDNRTFRVETFLPPGKSRLKPNLMARMSINDRTVEDVIVIPLNIIQNELDGKAFVYVAQEENDQMRAEKRYIETGLEYRGQIEIKSGLEEDDILIVRGHQNLSENQRLALHQ